MNVRKETWRPRMIKGRKCRKLNKLMDGGKTERERMSERIRTLVFVELELPGVWTEGSYYTLSNPAENLLFLTNSF